VAFFLISCEDALSPSEYPPLPNENPTGGEGEDPLGYWRIEGIIDAPLDWTPGYPYLVQIWMSGREGMDQLIGPIQFTHLFTGQDSTRWSFETRGDEYWWGDIYHLFFIPDPTWWSDPEEEVYGHTYVRGYKWVEFGGGYHLVLADEDTSFNPYNPPNPNPDWKYYQPYLYLHMPNCDLYWAWTSVYLDLR
jgi:hypothetical protein